MLNLRNQYCGAKADIWACGITLYAMIYGRVPFFSSNFMHTFELIKTSEPKYENITLDGEEWKNEQALRDLLNSILEKDPEKRASIKSILAHPWL